MPVMFKAIEPRGIYCRSFKNAVKEEGAKVLEGIKRDYQKGVRTWKTKVDFEAELITNSSGGVSITVDTDNEIYRFVHEGTRPHTIKPRKAKVLRFQGVFSAKTMPGVISSGPGGSSGPFQYRNVVSHPGTKGRKFTKVIFKKWRPFFERSMIRALEKGAKESGHAL